MIEDEDDDDGSKRAPLVAWLRQLPPAHTINWFSDHLSIERPWCISWIDVCTPEFDELVGWNWTVTIVHPEDSDNGETIIHASGDMMIPKTDWGNGQVFYDLPAWSPGRISQILNEWTETYTGRDDLSWNWNPDCGPSEQYLAALDALEEAIKDPSSRILLGVTEDGKEVYVASQVMDMIMALPDDERAKLTGETMKAFNEIGKAGLNG